MIRAENALNEDFVNDVLRWSLFFARIRVLFPRSAHELISMKKEAEVGAVDFLVDAGAVRAEIEKTKTEKRSGEQDKKKQETRNQTMDYPKKGDILLTTGPVILPVFQGEKIGLYCKKNIDGIPDVIKGSSITGRTFFSGCENQEAIVPGGKKKKSSVARMAGFRIDVRIGDIHNHKVYLEVMAHHQRKDFTKNNGLVYTDMSFLDALCRLVGSLCVGKDMTGTDVPAEEVEALPFIDYTEHGMQTNITVDMEAGDDLFQGLWDIKSAHLFMDVANGGSVAGLFKNGLFWRTRLGALDTRKKTERKNWPVE